MLSYDSQCHCGRTPPKPILAKHQKRSETIGHRRQRHSEGSGGIADAVSDVLSAFECGGDQVGDPSLVVAAVVA